MQSQPLSESKPIEAREQSEQKQARERAPAEIAADLQRQGEERAKQATDDVDEAWGFVEESGEADPKTQRRLEELRVEVAQAKSELIAETEAFIPKAEVKASNVSQEDDFDIESGWDAIEEKKDAEPSAADLELIRLESVLDQETDSETKLDLISEETEKSFTQEVSMDSLIALTRLGAKNTEFQKTIEKSLKSWLGTVATERILSNPEYLKQLFTLKQKLSKTYGENGPPLTNELNLANLVAIKETIGDDPEALAAAVDLKKDATELNPESNVPVLNILRAQPNAKTGELEVDIILSFEYKGPPEKKSDGEMVETSAKISRDIHRKAVSTEEGGIRMQTVVKHDIFQLPNTVKSNGIAARIQRDCLKQYDRIGIEEVTLYASLDMGGYAWASYGYGWDENLIGGNSHLASSLEGAVAAIDQEKILNELKQANPDLTDKDCKAKRDAFMREVRAKAGAEAAMTYEKMTDAQRIQYVEKGVQRIVRQFQKSALDALRDAGLLVVAGGDQDPQVTEMIKRLEDAVENPGIVTPQMIAALGRKGPFLRRGASSAWYTEAAYAEAIKNGDDQPDPDLADKPIHLGQVALMGNSWNGKMELTKNGRQGGKNRAILEQKLEQQEKRQREKSQAKVTEV